MKRVAEEKEKEEERHEIDVSDLGQ
jgi:hypothetical protein